MDTEDRLLRYRDALLGGAQRHHVTPGQRLAGCAR
jgi:hypothetical protein